MVKVFSHIGKKNNQEDSWAVSSDQKLFIVCDGVGGLEHGELASKLVCEKVISLYELLGDDFKSTHLKDLIIQAQKSLTLHALKCPETERMSTTYVLVYIDKGMCHISHMGDSKALVVDSNKGLAFATRDDSLVQDLYDDKILKTEQAILVHPLRNKITKMLSAKLKFTSPDQNLSLDIQLPKSCFVLLGSDGAFENYTTSQIVSHFMNTDLTLESRWDLYKQYCESTSHDNATAILVSH